MKFRDHRGPAEARHQSRAQRADHRSRWADFPWPSHKGLYSFDTRLISSWNIYANGAGWELLYAGDISYYAS